MEGIAQCIIITSPLFTSYARKRKCYSTRIFGSSISIQQIRQYCWGEILKPQEDGTRKGRTQ
jgi:hypothetical protein